MSKLGSKKKFAKGERKVTSETTQAVPAVERVRQHREELRRRGMRPITLWVPDTRSPDFAAELARQCALIRASNETNEDVAFADHLADELLREMDEEGL